MISGFVECFQVLGCACFFTFKKRDLNKNPSVKMQLQWVKPLGLLFCLIQAALCCYKREDIFVNDPRELVPEGLPNRMLGWEQMILMFSNQPKDKVYFK